MRKKIVCVLYALLWLCLAALVLVDNVLTVGTNDALYYKMQLRAGVAETAGITEEDLYLLDERLALCLESRANWNDDWSWNGRDKAFRVTVNGIEQDAFNAREVAHMEDCAELFASLRTVRQILLVAILLLWSAAHIVKRQIEFNLPALTGIVSLMICIPIAVFGVWAVIDFDSAFAFFHRCLFSNDLWLLNPETDLLIRICPSSMFAGLGLRIAVRTALPLLGFPLMVCVLFRVEKRLNKRKKERNEIADL